MSWLPPMPSTVSICCCPAGAKLKVHVTVLLFFAIALSTSLQFAQDYPVGVAHRGGSVTSQCIVFD